MTQEEKIKDLEEKIVIMQAADSELCANLAHWKKVAAGLKGRNKQLSEQLQHYKELDLEGDELYEKKIAQCDDLQKQLDDANCKIKELQVLNASYTKSIVDYKDKNIELEQENENLRIAIKYKKTPWWGKIFCIF